MELREHNERLESEVIGWKAKVDDVIKKFDKMPSGDKEKVAPFFDELNIAIEELTAKLEKFNSEYAAHKAADKTETGGKANKFKKIWKEMWRNSMRMHYGHL